MERDTGEREKVEEKGQLRRESEIDYPKLGFPFLTSQEIFFLTDLEVEFSELDFQVAVFLIDLEVEFNKLDF